MALAKETLDYLKLVPIVKTLPKQAFLVLYDDEADVLYIDFHNPPRSAEDTELTDDDVVIRYGNQDEIVGLTVLYASQRS